MTDQPTVPNPAPEAPPIPIFEFLERVIPYLFALLAILLVWAVISLIRSSLARQRARNLPRHEQLKNRVEFLTEASRIAKGSVGKPVRLKLLSKNLRVPIAQIQEARAYLEDKGLVKAHSPEIAAWSVIAGPQVTVTSKGIDELDAARQAPERPTTYLAPLTIMGNVTGGQIVNASPSSNPTNISGSQVSAFTQQFSDAMREDPLPPEDERVARAYLSVIEAQLFSGRPDQEAIRQAGKSLRAISEGVVSSAVWAAVTAMAQRLGL